MNLLQNEVVNNNNLNSPSSAPSHHPTNMNVQASSSPATITTGLITANSNTISSNLAVSVNKTQSIPVQHQQQGTIQQQQQQILLNQMAAKATLQGNQQQQQQQLVVNNASTTIMNPSISVPSHSVINNNKIQPQQQSIVATTRLIGPSVQQQNIRNIVPMQPQTIRHTHPPTNAVTLQSQQIQQQQQQIHQFRRPVGNAPPQQMQQQQQFMTQNSMPLQQSQPQSAESSTAMGFYDPMKVLNKPMDSATKSSFQEFTRYQLQYNLSQEQKNNNNNNSGSNSLSDGIQSSVPQQNNATLASTSSSSSSSIATPSANLQQMLIKSEPKQPATTPNVVGPVQVTQTGGGDALGLNNLTDLPDLNLTKNELDSLLPTLNPSELECALFDTKFESLLEGKDLDIDLKNESSVNVPPTNAYKSSSQAVSFPSDTKATTALTAEKKQQQVIT